MELKDYIRIITKNYLLIAIITVLIMLATYFVTKNQPPSFDGAVTFTVINSERFPPNQYGYDYYFTIQSASLLADTIDGWFGSPGFVKQVYDTAQVNFPATDTKSAARLFKSIKEIEKSTVVTVSIKTDKAEETSRLVTAASTVVTQEIERLKKSQKIPDTFTIIAS
ncbi:hypothetical protein HY065_01270, partial [Candidatus Berkelbacteria bacterium]|nr:hypothetical protein [Candidatus Berkelbacteria bacterium]